MKCPFCQRETIINVDVNSHKNSIKEIQRECEIYKENGFPCLYKETRFKCYEEEIKPGTEILVTNILGKEFVLNFNGVGEYTIDNLKIGIWYGEILETVNDNVMNVPCWKYGIPYSGKGG